MVKKKIDLIDWYKIVGIGIVFLIMATCQFRWFEGMFQPIAIPKELWTAIGLMITHTFMSVTGVKLPPLRQWQHLRGLVLVFMLLMVGLSVYLGLAVGEQWWTLLGSVIAFLYGSEKGDEGI